jgi:hypothetical protein
MKPLQVMLVLVALFVACSDLPDAPKQDLVAPPAPTQSVVAATPAPAGSTLCEAFQHELSATRAALAASPGNAELTAREGVLASITTDVCG